MTGSRTSRPFKVPALVLIVILAAALSLHAQAEEPEVIILDPQPTDADSPVPPPNGAAGTDTVPFPTQGMNSREILSDLWFRHRALMRRGESEEAERVITTAQGFMEREGIRAAPEIAAAFLAGARAAYEDGDYRTAEENFRLALRFDAAHPGAHWGLAATLLRGDRDLSGAVASWWNGLRSTVENPEVMYITMGNCFLVVFAGLCCGAALALILMAVRCAPAFLHDLQERFSGRLSVNAAHLLGWILLSLPLILQLPLAWALALWGALFFTYLRGADRVVAAAALCMLLAVGPAGRFLVWHYGTATDPVARALLQSVRTGPDMRHDPALRQIASQKPNDPIYPFLLGSAYRAGGHFAEAMDMYRQVLKIDPGHARAMVNLGNLHALRQEFALAQDLYSQAAAIDPGLALAHYNSHLAHLETFSMEAADDELRRARRIDEGLISGIMAGGEDARTRRSPQDTTYSPREIWNRAAHLRLGGGIRQEVARALTSTATVAGGAGILAALLMPGLGLAPRTGAARRCRRCGRAFCRRCRVGTKYPDSCSQCIHLFILRDGLAPSVRDRKMAEVIRYRRQVFLGTRIASLFLPGSGHVIGGRALLGTLLLATWATALFGIALRGRLLVSTGPSWAANRLGALLIWLAVALATWVMANLSRHEPSPD